MAQGGLDKNRKNTQIQPHGLENPRIGAKGVLSSRMLRPTQQKSLETCVAANHPASFLAD